MEDDDIPLDDRAAAIRATGKDVRKEFERAAAHSEKVAGVISIFVYSSPVPWLKDTDCRVFRVGVDNEMDAALLTYLDEEAGVDFAAIAAAQNGRDDD